eukprot:gene3799-5927_t
MATGGSCIGIKYKDGVLMASDTLVTMYHTKKLPNQQRHYKIGEPARTVVLTTGLVADTEYMINELRDLERDDRLAGDGVKLTGPRAVHSYMKLVMYNKRTDFNPALFTAIIGGKDVGKEPFLGWVDSVGTHAESSCFSTGMGHYLAIGMLREASENDKWKSLTKEQAMKVVEACMTVFFYRDTDGFNRIQVTDCTDAGVVTGEPYELKPTLETR